MKLVYIAGALALAGSTVVHAGTVRGYNVGNSLTGQSFYGGIFDEMVTSRGSTLTAGYHIRGGQGLKYIYEHPTDPTFTGGTFGNFNDALDGYAWDYATFEPYQPDTREQSRGIISNMIGLTRSNAANAKTRFFVYQGWPQEIDSYGDYSTRWDGAYDPSEAHTMWSRDYFAGLMTEVRADRPGVTINLIPIGEVMYRLDQLAKAGNLPGYSDIEQVYVDSYHLNVTAGVYIASVVTYATVFGDNPVGLDRPDGVSPELAAAIQQTTWSVVNGNPLTGVPEPTTIAAVIPAMAVLMRRRRS